MNKMSRKLYLVRATKEPPVIVRNEEIDMRIYHIGVHTMYYGTRALFSSTKSRIYDKEKHD